MTHLLRSFTVAIAIATTSPLLAQNWRDAMGDPNASFYDIQANFYAEWGAREQQNAQARQDNTLITDKWIQNDPQNPTPFPYMKGGYKQFKRWEYFMEPRVFPSGDISLPSTNYQRFCDYLDQTPDAMGQYYGTFGQYPLGPSSNPNARIGPPPPNPMSSTWTFMGPTGYPSGGGAGRINVIRFDPQFATNNTMYAGAPAGGLWKSTNGGTTWAIVPSTDQLASIGITDIAIDPTNNQVLYIATGDGDAGDTYSVGVLKSTDGGVTWNTTGLNWTTSQGRTISRLLINPSNNQVLIAFTSNGIYRTSNAGTSWTQVQNTNSFRDGEFQPGNPSIVYGSGTRFWKSTDGGVTWTNTATGLPLNTAVDRFSVAVTAANTNYVYILAGSAANNGFYGVYRSTDAGATFTQRSSTPNIMGWSATGSDTGGQSWYDHGFDVAPGNADHVMVGGVNHWRSTNGGTSWTLNAHWTGSGAPYVHADVHCIVYAPTPSNNTTRYFSGNDGGINETTNSGGAWADRSAQLCIAQPYRIGLSASNASLWLTGHQDNGTNRFNGTWAEVMGGDGMDCFIDRTNNNTMYAEYYNGAFNRSTNGGGTWTGITTGLTGAAAWVTPWCQDPAAANTLWCGYTNVFRSTNQGTSWTQMGTLGGSGTIVDIKVSQSTPSTIYCCRSNAVYKSINTGGTWTAVTGTLPVGSAAITRLCIDPSDANNVWVTFSGYSAANKVFVTTNGGASWTNITTGLPNIPANCIVYTPGSTNDAIYVGMDIGVYYRDNTTGAWAPYFTGLPNVPIFDLEIYAPTSKVRCASFGRGVWEVDVYNPGTLAPVADFTASQTLVCAGTPVNFTDLSSFTPTSWSWSFQGGTPATSTAQNPTGITWSTPGTYSVTLTATNTNGSDSETKTSYITVMPSAVAPPLVEGFVSTTFLPTNWTAYNANNDGIYWDRSATVGNTPTAGNSARFDNYNNDVGGARDEMWCPPQTMASMSTCSLTFDVAYARYDAVYTDTLEVMVSTNCGATWTSVFLKGGTTLATAPDNTNLFVPTAAQWRNENINLNTYCGQGNVLIKFVNRGRYGNCLYVDNVNIAGTSGALPSATFTASTSSVCAGTPVNFTSTSSGSPTSWTWTFPSGTPASASTQNVTGVVWNTPGTYTVTHTATNLSGTGTTTQVITVLATPTVTATAGTTTICAGGSTTLTGGGASTYSWMPGSLSGTTVTVSPATTTTYTVTGTAANGCTSTATRTITVNPSPTVSVTGSPTTICSGNSSTLTASGATSYSWMPGSLTGTSVTVSPATTTTYTVTGTSAGCSSTATQLITVNPTPTVTVSASQSTICTGSSTTITASGATTYSWMPGSLTGTSVNVSPGSTTTYTVTGTTSGCSGTATQLITVNTSPTVTASSSTTTICSGNPATLSASGASTYSWMPGSMSGTPVTVSPATTTTYTVTGTAANGCTSTATQLITVNTTPTVTASSSTTTICSGNSVSLTASGASTYNWMPGSMSGTPVTVSPATTTTYTVTGTAANGCTATATRTITVNTSPTVTASSSTTTICSGSSVTLTASGGSTYNWMPGSLSGSTVSVSPSSTTTYTVTGTAANGCTATAAQMITVNASPTVTTSAAPAAICDGGPTTITANGASTYSWMPGSLTGTSVNVTPSSTTTYTVTGAAANGCTASTTQLITVTPTPTVSISATTVTVCNGSSTTLTASGATTYSWMPGSLTGTSVTVSPGSTTTYTVTGTTSGCSSTATQLITVNTTPTVTASSSTTTICSGNSVSLTASGASTYNWMPGSLSGSPVSASPATTTTYTVTGTAANGCTSTATRTITVNASPTVNLTASNGSICTGGSTTLTASGASTYNWMPGSMSGTPVTVSPGSTTTYTATGTAANGCTGTQTLIITVGSQPTVTVTSNTAICTGQSATLTASGTSTYNWMPGSLTGGTVTVTPTVTTTYTVTGTNAPGCSNTATVTVTVNAVPNVTASASTLTVCSGSPTTLTGNGGVTYSWMPGSLSGTTVSVSPTANTTYTVTGTAANGCTDNGTIAISVSALPNLTVTPATTTICVGSSVAVSGSPAGGPNTYLWTPAAGLANPNAAATTATPTITTTYVLTKTNNTTGCFRQDTAIVVVNQGPTVVPTASSSTICAGNTVTLSATGAVTYNWMPGNLNGASVNVTPAGTTTYTVTGTDAMGCTRTQTITITVGPPPTVTASTSSPSVCVGSSATLTGNGATSYTWMPGSLTGATVTVNPSATTTYTVTGTNGPGCSNTATVTVTVNALPTVTASASAPAICTGGSTSLTGNGASTYSWMPGSMSGTTVSVSPGSGTTYTVTGTAANGCSNTSTVAVTVNALPSVTASSSSGTICQGSNIILSGSGASAYSWMPGSMSGASVNDAPASSTTYTVTGTDINGCSATATVAVTVNANPSVTSSASSGAICTGANVTLTANGASAYNWMPGSMSGAVVTDVPASSTTYTVTGTDGNGCSGTSTVTVTVNSLPSVTSSASSGTICMGDGVTLTANGASAYNWMPGSISGSPVTDAPASSTTYTVTGTDGNGCSATSTVSVTVNPLPNVTFTIPTDTFCDIDGPTPLSGGMPAGGVYSGPGVSGGMFDPSSIGGGTYTLMYTYMDANGCSDSAAQTVIVDICSGTNDPAPVLTVIGIVPNPNNGEFQLTFEVVKTDDYVLEIHNAAGQIVQQQVLPSFSGRYSSGIDLRQYGRGVYTIRLRSSTNEVVERVITF